MFCLYGGEQERESEQIRTRSFIEIVSHFVGRRNNSFDLYLPSLVCQTNGTFLCISFDFFFFYSRLLFKRRFMQLQCAETVFCLHTRNTVWSSSSLQFRSSTANLAYESMYNFADCNLTGENSANVWGRKKIKYYVWMKFDVGKWISHVARKNKCLFCTLEKSASWKMNKQDATSGSAFHSTWVPQMNSTQNKAKRVWYKILCFVFVAFSCSLSSIQSTRPVWTPCRILPSSGVRNVLLVDIPQKTHWMQRKKWFQSHIFIGFR